VTFVIGLESCDGIVMCSDSFEDDGITKKTVDKIRQITMSGGWNSNNGSRSWCGTGQIL